MGRYITAEGTSQAVIRNVNGAFTAAVNDRILLDSSGGSFTVTLPPLADLVEGDLVQMIDVGSSLSTNTVTVARNSAKIVGATEDLTLDVDGAVITLLYTGSTYGWVLTST